MDLKRSCFKEEKIVPGFPRSDFFVSGLFAVQFSSKLWESMVVQ